MYSMDNLELDIINRQFIYEAHSFLGNEGVPALPSHYGAATMTTLQIPSHPTGSTGSTSGSDLYFYDENSSDNESVYSSDQENHTREAKNKGIKRSYEDGAIFAVPEGNDDSIKNATFTPSNADSLDFSKNDYSNNDFHHPEIRIESTNASRANLSQEGYIGKIA